MLILVTGANGFVGRALCHALVEAGHRVRKSMRAIYPAASVSTYDAAGGADQTAAVGDIGPDTDWTPALEGVHAIVHLAARVHVINETARNPLAEFRRVNASGTECLARAAARAGVRRLVFASTIKVNGEETTRTPFTEADAPNPQDSYALSKWEAEQALQRVAAETGLEVVVLRPPLVYGPEVKGNFLRLWKAVDRGIPLPLAWAANRRSLIYLGNLVDAIMVCMSHPEASGKTYLVSDGEDISTAELVFRMADALDRPARLWPVPPSLMRLAGTLVGKSTEAGRLLDSLQLDCTKIRRELGWLPPYSMAQGLAETAEWYHLRPKTIPSSR